MISQEVECPACKHKHFMKDDIANLIIERNKHLENAFRDIMKVCIEYVPLEHKGPS